MSGLKSTQARGAGSFDFFPNSHGPRGRYRFLNRHKYISGMMGSGATSIDKPRLSYDHSGVAQEIAEFIKLSKRRHFGPPSNSSSRER